MSQHSVRFPSLNGFRIIAAVLVVIFHIEYKKTLYDLPSFWGDNYFITNIGYHAVTLFFVLSGFLITHLLILEKNRFNTINFKYFYARRSLRIFPVYFITIFVGFILAPNIPMLTIPGQTETLIQNFWPALGLSSIFASNVVFAQFGSLAGIDQTWSVSTEEQFYIIWPLVIFLIASMRKLIVFLVAIIVCGLLFRVLSVFYNFGDTVETLFYLNRFGCMAIGGIFSIITVQHVNSRLSKIILSRSCLFISLILMLILLFFPILGKLNLFLPEILAVLFSVIISHGAAGHLSRDIFDNRFMHYGGNLSYSLYMYHNFIIAFVCNLVVANGLSSHLSPFWLSISILISVLVLSFFISIVSWKYMEKPFLKLKSKFTTIESKP